MIKGASRGCLAGYSLRVRPVKGGHAFAETVASVWSPSVVTSPTIPTTRKDGGCAVVASGLASRRRPTGSSTPGHGRSAASRFGTTAPAGRSHTSDPRCRHVLRHRGRAEDPCGSLADARPRGPSRRPRPQPRQPPTSPGRDLPMPRAGARAGRARAELASPRGQQKSQPGPGADEHESSITKCRATSPRPAPSAARVACSRRWASARPRTRLETLVKAITRSSEAASRRSHNESARSPVNDLLERSDPRPHAAVFDNADHLTLGKALGQLPTAPVEFPGHGRLHPFALT